MKRLCLAAATLMAGVFWTTTHAQEIDFSGEWRPLYHEDGQDRIPGPDLGDYSGLPLNDSARLRADSYTTSRMSLVMENICRQHGADYALRGMAHMRITIEVNPVSQQVLAFRMRFGNQNMERMIWLDDHAPPGPKAPLTWQGFSTGHWEANQLVIKTTHLKENYRRRNGVPSGPKRTMTEQWIRHGNILTIVSIVEDPEFLTEPLVLSQNWVLDPGQQMATDGCEYVPELPTERGAVPHYLPGTNPFLTEVAERYGLPAKGVRGGAETMYPEFRLTMGPPAAKPERCKLYCTCMNTGMACPDVQR